MFLYHSLFSRKVDTVSWICRNLLENGLFKQGIRSIEDDLCNKSNPVAVWIKNWYTILYYTLRDLYA